MTKNRITYKITGYRLYSQLTEVLVLTFQDLPCFFFSYLIFFFYYNECRQWLRRKPERVGHYLHLSILRIIK